MCRRCSLSFFLPPIRGVGIERASSSSSSMAFSANSIISHNRTLIIPLSFPFLKLRNPPTNNNINLQYPSHSNTPITISASVANTNPSVEVDDNNTLNSTTTQWSEFARNVSGEWDGYGADFTSEGKPIELAENVVPEAFREWEVQVFDWQTQCPTLALPQDQHRVATYKLISLLPTVGCEADAATRYTVDERNIGGPHNNVSAFAYQSTGCYVAVWPKEMLLELEHCLIDPRNRESRVRIIQVVGVDKTKLVLKNIKVFCEQWYGPFRNGEQLGGCAIRDSGFAATHPLKGSDVTGVWRGPNVVASFNTCQTAESLLLELLDDSVRTTVRDEHDLVLLPKQLWCSLKEREDGETCGEVGWLLEQGRAITSRCIFSSNGKLKEISITCETAALEGM